MKGSSMLLTKALIVLSLLIVILQTASVAIAGPIEIHYWGMWTNPPYDAIEKVVVDRFNQLYAGKIRVIGNPMAEGETEEKLAVAVTGGMPPEVVKVGRHRTGSLAAAGFLQALDDLIRRDELNMENYLAPAIKEATYKGRIYGIPWNTDGRALYYNVDLFEELGLDPESPPKTWEDVDAYCRKIDSRAPDGRWRRVGFTPWQGDWYFVGWLWAAGGDLLDETYTKVTWAEEPGVRAAEWMQSYIRRYGWNVPYDRGFSVAHGEFWQGALAMLMHGSWFLGDTKVYAPKTRISIAPPPRPRGLEKEPITWGGGFMLSIPTGVSNEKRDAAWEFIKFYTDEWAQVLLGSRSGQIPVQKSAISSKEFLSVHPLMYKMVQLMPYARFRPPVPAGAELWDLYHNRVYSLLAEGKMPAREIVKETARLAQMALDKAWREAKIK